MLYYRNQPSKPDGVKSETISRVRSVLCNLSNKSKVSISFEEKAVEQHESKVSVSLKEAVHQLQDSLEAALVKGYSYEELADLLQQEGIPISSSSLKNYLASTRRQTPESKISTNSEDQHSDNPSNRASNFTNTEQLLPTDFVSSDLSASQLQKIQELAQVYGIPCEILLQKSLEDWAKFPANDSDEATEYVLTKNAELYRRLA
ncbi:MAG: type I secretion C-terminal target domain-containing protein [Oculatellaceae cyanobacterium bins.114]|nr:type I secretion C-terminal target domain-containing protein [Oculatellaceae cyanobacterium bins.114]